MCAIPALADPLRIATFNVALSRKGPGLLLRDIQLGKDAQIEAVIAVLVRAGPDIVLLTDIDYDADLLALSALQTQLSVAGLDLPYRFARRPNSGMATGLDMDGNGRRGQPRDAQGYGDFAGQGGMAVLSRYPISAEEAQDFSTLLWRDVPGALLPQTAEGPFPSEAAQAVQRLSSVGHWVVPVQVGERRISLLCFHATPAVFDGPEDRNGLRNRDEARLWSLVLDGALGRAVQGHPIVLGISNLDPEAGEGDRATMQALLEHPALQDPRPVGADGAARTVDWPDPVPGDLRVDYVLPAAGLGVTAAGVLWPEAGDPFADVVAKASRHRLVWVDIALP